MNSTNLAIVVAVLTVMTMMVSVTQSSYSLTSITYSPSSLQWNTTYIPKITIDFTVDFTGSLPVLYGSVFLSQSDFIYFDEDNVVSSSASSYTYTMCLPMTMVQPAINGSGLVAAKNINLINTNLQSVQVSVPQTSAITVQKINPDPVVSSFNMTTSGNWIFVHAVIPTVGIDSVGLSITEVNCKGYQSSITLTSNDQTNYYGYTSIDKFGCSNFVVSSLDIKDNFGTVTQFFANQLTAINPQLQINYAFTTDYDYTAPNITSFTLLSESAYTDPSQAYLVSFEFEYNETQSGLREYYASLYSSGLSLSCAVGIKSSTTGFGACIIPPFQKPTTLRVLFILNDVAENEGVSYHGSITISNSNTAKPVIDSIVYSVSSIQQYSSFYIRANFTYTVSNSYVDSITSTFASINNLDNCMLVSSTLTSGFVSCWIYYSPFQGTGDFSNLAFSITQTDSLFQVFTAGITTSVLPKPSGYAITKLQYPSSGERVIDLDNNGVYYYNFSVATYPKEFTLPYGYFYLNNYGMQFGYQETMVGYVGGNSSNQQYYGVLSLPSYNQPGYYVPHLTFQSELGALNLNYQTRYFTKQCILATKSTSQVALIPTIVSITIDKPVLTMTGVDQSISIKLVLSRGNGAGIPNEVGVSAEGLFDFTLQAAKSNNPNQLVYYGATMVSPNVQTGRYALKVSISPFYDEYIDILPSQLAFQNLPHYVDVTSFPSTTQILTQNNTISKVVLSDNQVTNGGGYQINFTISTNGGSVPFDSYTYSLVKQDKKDSIDLVYKNFRQSQYEANVSLIITQKELCSIGYTRYALLTLGIYSNGIHFRFERLFNLTIDQTQCDRISSFVQSLMISGARYNAGQVDTFITSNVYIDFHIIDNLSGFKSLDIRINTPSSIIYVRIDQSNRISGNFNDGIYRYILNVPAGSLGNYTITPAYMYDNYHNYQYFTLQNLKLVGNPIIVAVGGTPSTTTQITSIVLNQNIITVRNQHLILEVNTNVNAAKVELLFNPYYAVEMTQVTTTNYKYDAPMSDYNEIYYYSIRVTSLDGTVTMYSTEALKQFTTKIFVQSKYGTTSSPVYIQSIGNTYTEDTKTFKQIVDFNTMSVEDDVIISFQCVLTNVNNTAHQYTTYAMIVQPNTTFQCIFNDVAPDGETYEFSYLLYQSYVDDEEGFPSLTSVYTPWVIKNVYSLSNSYTFTSDDGVSISSNITPQIYLISMIVTILISLITLRN